MNSKTKKAAKAYLCFMFSCVVLVVLSALTGGAK